MRKSKALYQPRARTTPVPCSEQWNSEYDSTWEDDGDSPEENEEKRKKERRQQQSHLESSRTKTARDLQNYRHGYPTLKNESAVQKHGGSSKTVMAKIRNTFSKSPEQSPLASCLRGEPEDRKAVILPKTPNFDFYKNRIPFEPKGVYIDEVLRTWNNEELERNHSYIQWLFPLREMGRNSEATPLTLEEIERMKQDDDVMRRFRSAYVLMLRFYGIRLQNFETGEVERSKDYQKRFQNLDNHTHNNLRITRILKILGELGYEWLKAPLVMFFLKETLCEGNLRNVQRSALDYFIFTVKSKQERKELVYFAWQNYKLKDRFIWGPVRKIEAYGKRKMRKEAQVPQDVTKGEGGDRKINSPLQSFKVNGQCAAREYQKQGVSEYQKQDVSEYQKHGGCGQRRKTNETGNKNVPNYPSQPNKSVVSKPPNTLKSSNSTPIHTKKNASDVPSPRIQEDKVLSGVRRRKRR